MIRIGLAIIVLGAIFAVIFYRSHPHGNLLRPTTDVHAWLFGQQAQDAGELHVDGNALRCNITTADGHPDHLFIFQSSASVFEGHKYLVHFRAKADKTRNVHLTCFRSSGLDTVIALTPAWQDYNYTYIAQKVWPQPSRLPIFQVGDMAGSIWLQDVSVEEIE
jgi:hypothetical protein